MKSLWATGVIETTSVMPAEAGIQIARQRAKKFLALSVSKGEVLMVRHTHHEDVFTPASGGALDPGSAAHHGVLRRARGDANNKFHPNGIVPSRR
jgi:hypothetical protein